MACASLAAARPGPTAAAASFSTFFPILFVMALIPQDIERLARLARLALTPAESAGMLTQLNGFFAILGKRRAVDTPGLTPVAHPVAGIESQALRLGADLVSEPDQRQANQQSAPAVEGGLYLVPKMIQSSSKPRMNTI